DPMEADDATAAFLAAIEADVVRAEAGREPRREQEVLLERRDLEPQRAGAIVPVEGEEAIDLLQARRAFLDGWRAAGRRGLTAAAATLRKGRSDGEKRHDEYESSQFA